MIKGFRNISSEASIILAGLQPITYSVRKRALMYAAKHPDHYLSTKIIPPGVHLSHIEKTLNIANDVNIDISDYKIPIKNFNTHPAKRSQILINLVQSDNYPIAFQIL